MEGLTLKSEKFAITSEIYIHKVIRHFFYEKIYRKIAIVCQGKKSHNMLRI